MQTLGFGDFNDLTSMSSDMTDLEEEACEMDPDEKKKKLARLAKKKHLQD